MSIKKWRKEIDKYFPEYVLPAEIVLSVVCQLCIKDITNPFGLVLVDVPSSGKTIILNFFSGLEDIVYITDDFTPSSFVSQAANRTEEELLKIDLLPKIKDKLFLIRDLVPLFGKRDDDLLKLMGILTRVFDGDGLLMNSAIHGQRGYKKRHIFMFLGASTPIPFRIWKVMGSFGARLFFLNLNTPDKDYETLANQLRDELSPKQKEKKCIEATNAFIASVFKGVRTIKWEKYEDDQSLLIEIAKIAKLLASLRGVINVWEEENHDLENPNKKLNYTMPVIEKPDRINQLLYNLARGHAVACGRRTIMDKDVVIVLKVALSSAPIDRVRLLKILIDGKDQLTADDIMNELEVSRPTALKLMKKLVLLGIAYEDDFRKKVKGIALCQDLKWLRSERFRRLNTGHTESKDHISD